MVWRGGAGGGAGRHGGTAPGKLPQLPLITSYRGILISHSQSHTKGGHRRRRRRGAHREERFQEERAGGRGRQGGSLTEIHSVHI